MNEVVDPSARAVALKRDEPFKSSEAPSDAPAVSTETPLKDAARLDGVVNVPESEPPPVKALFGALSPGQPPPAPAPTPVQSSEELAGGFPARQKPCEASESTATQPIVVEPEGSAAAPMAHAPSQEQKPPTIIVPDVGAVGKHEREQRSPASAGAFDPNPSAADASKDSQDKDSQQKLKRAKLAPTEAP